MANEINGAGKVTGRDKERRLTFFIFYSFFLLLPLSIGKEGGCRRAKGSLDLVGNRSTISYITFITPIDADM